MQSIALEPAAPSLADARLLAEQGNVAGAIELAVRAARATGDLDVHTALVQWRRDAYVATPHPAGRPDWPPCLPDPFPGHDGVPRIGLADATADIIGGAILHHGALVVKGLVSRGAAEVFRQGIEQAWTAREAFEAGRQAIDPAWFVPVESADAPELHYARSCAQMCCGLWAADSPPMLSRLIDLLTQCCILDSISELMGERPLLTVTKSTLRRVEPVTRTNWQPNEYGWHQDGVVIGRDVRAVNLWLALTDCGVDAPGLDLLARRIPYYLQTGSHGAWVENAIGNGLVDLLVEGGASIVSPVFEAGDAVLFDPLTVHRSAVRQTMRHTRWAIEAWLLAPTGFPIEQLPLVI